MRKSVVAMLVSSGFLVSGTVMAQEMPQPTFDYVSVGYVDVETENGDSLDGFRVDFSASLPYNLFVRGGVMAVDDDIELAGASYDFESGNANVMLGYRFDIQPNLALYAGPYAMRSFVDIDNARTYDWGFGIASGVKYRPIQPLELNAEVNYTDVHDAYLTNVEIGARYYINNEFSLQATAAFGDNDSWGVNAAYHF